MAKIIWRHSTAIRRRIKGIIFLLFAAALMVGALGPQRALACDITDVDLWIGNTESHAQEKNPYDVFKCPGCSFGWYVEWEADPGYGDFYGEVWLASTLVYTFTADSSKDLATGTHSVPGNMSCGPKTVQAWMRRVGEEWCYSNTRTLVVTEVEDVIAGAKHATETLYRAQDYLDEPSERETLTQGVTAVLSEATTPDCFYWTPDCDEYLPTICPDDATGATFSAINHDLYSIWASCGNSFKTMSIALEGINIYTPIISPEDEMTETYNIFLNENFNQQRESSTLPGHKQCYYVDNSDNSITNPNTDNVLEIGAISLYAAIYGDTDATVKFNSSGIKLYDSSQDKNKLEFNTKYNIVDIGGSICVEGISTGTTTLAATIETQDGYTTTDQLKIKVIPLDLVAVDPAPSSDQHEICHKDKLIIPVNHNDSDNDGTVDLLDFNIAGGDPELAHIILEKPTGAVDSDISTGKIYVTFPSNLNAFKNQYKTGGEAPDSYSLSDLPKDIYLEGESDSSDILDTSVTAYMYLNLLECHDEIRYTVIKVDLLVNNTTAETDDYVVMEKSSGVRVTPVDTPAGATDNHIPMKIHLDGPSGFSCKVKLSDSGGGNITIKKTDGSPYPAEGETVTVGTDLEVHIFGTTPSSNLNDVTITAKTDKTGDRVCAEEDLTVIWIYGSNMSFRGSSQQGQALTVCSAAKNTNFNSWEYDKVGKFIYHKPTGPYFDVAYNYMELKNQISPNVVISDVEWDIKREISRASWGPGSGSLSPTYKGETGWADDDSVNIDEDREQNIGCTEIFVIDATGNEGLTYTTGYRFTYKGKFREWVEVKIGGKWYVCSPYKDWRSIMHIKFKDSTDGWIYDTSKTNEVVLGTISGFAGTWSE